MTSGNSYADEQALIGDLFASHPQARMCFDNLSKWLLSKPEVNRTPCKTYVGFRTKRQFAIARPTRSDSLEIGLALLPSTNKLLSPAKNFGSTRMASKLEIQEPSINAAVRSVIERSLGASS